jgi:hypothetical protein
MKTITIAEKHDGLYNATLIACVMFMVLLAAGIAFLKLNETPLETTKPLGNEEDVVYPKINIKVDFSDGGDKSLIIPIQAPIDEKDISVQEEFMENKYVITMAGYADNVSEEIGLIGDLNILDAAGAYSQNENVTVEAYCDDVYDYDVVVDDSSIVVNFYNIDEKYDHKALLWTPYQERGLFVSTGFGDELSAYAKERGIKLYQTCELGDEYSQDDVIKFANKIKADMVIGIDIEDAQGANSYMAGVCNTSYFMPDFDSAGLSVELVDGFAQSLDLEVRDFIEADANTPLVYNAVVPSALIRLCVPANSYNLNEKIINGIENTIDNVIMKWGNGNDEGE